jgi:pyruvate formate lyase activating enzyme
LNIKGFQKSSFIDYPDKIAAVVFTGGCNFRCPYCHNKELVYNIGENIDEREIIGELQRRKKYLDGVCITGGEPTLQTGIRDFIVRIKRLGYLVKLDTNGTSPEVLKLLIGEGLLDYIAMDIKAPLQNYRSVTVDRVDIEKIKESIEIIKCSGVDYEFRTTICKELLSAGDILKIAKSLKGSMKYTLQNYRESGNILSGEKYTPYKREELELLIEEIKSYFDKFHIRY